MTHPPAPCPHRAAARAALALFEARLTTSDPDGDGVRAWRAGVLMAARALDLGAEEAFGGLSAAWAVTFGRIVQSPRRADRFEPAPEAHGPGQIPAMIMDLDDDLLALDLRPESRRFWRLTGQAETMVWSGDPGEVIQGETLLLRQDAHGWVRALVRAMAWRRDLTSARLAASERVLAEMRARLGRDGPGPAPTDPAEREIWRAGVAAARVAAEAAEASFRNLNPEPAARGLLVLAPAALTWTKAGMLKGVEAVEILDAPANGALGRVLRRLNRKIGRPQVRGGVALYGAEPGGAREFGVAA